MFCNSSRTTAVAVLQAITSILMFLSSKNCTISNVYWRISSTGRVPYGQRAESPRKIMDSFGNCLRASLRTVRPPTPESINPIGLFMVSQPFFL